MKYYTCEAIQRPEVKRWQERLKERYTPPRGIKLTVLFPCSAKKPYLSSKSHMAFRRALKAGAGRKFSLVHELTLTSPLGVVPRELETVYPACCYDTAVSGYWSGEEKAAVRELVEDYRSKSPSILLGYCSGAYAGILGSMKLEVRGGEKLLSRESLKGFEDRVREILRGEEGIKRNRGLEKLRAIAELQFGLGMGEKLIPIEARIKGREVYSQGEVIARLGNRGFLNLTLKGGKILAQSERYTVHIDFQPRTNSILCPGVTGADREIRPRDEVAVVYRGEVAGVGKAVLSGQEMLEAGYGVAVRLRKRA